MASVIKEIFKVSPLVDPFCQMNFSFELSPGYPNCIDYRLLERENRNSKKPYEFLKFTKFWLVYSGEI